MKRDNATAQSVAVPQKKSRLAVVWKNLRKNKMAITGACILIVFVFCAAFADVLFDYDEVVTNIDVMNRFVKPCAEHPFGTDELGRDMLGRIVHGTRASLSVGFVAVTFSLLVGVPLGAIAGLKGGRVSEVIMRFADILSALPNIMLALAIVTAFGQSLINLMIAVGISSIPGYIRIVRASVLTEKNKEYVEAVSALGGSNTHILIKHVLPNCLAPIIVQATLRMATAILSIASLSFLGLGIKPPTPEWGLMLSSGRTYLRDAWWMTFFPGVAIMLSVLSLNLLGDGLRDALDPKLKK